MDAMTLHIQVLEREGKWHAWVPAVPGVEATGETRHAAVEMAATLALSVLANLRTLGKPTYGPNLGRLESSEQR